MFAALKKVVLLHRETKAETLSESDKVPDLQSKAEIAQLVEHDLAKVGVASSSLVFRSKPGGVSGAARAEANVI